VISDIQRLPGVRDGPSSIISPNLKVKDAPTLAKNVSERVATKPIGAVTVPGRPISAHEIHKASLPPGLFDCHAEAREIVCTSQEPLPSAEPWVQISVPSPEMIIVAACTNGAPINNTSPHTTTNRRGFFIMPPRELLYSSLTLVTGYREATLVGT